MNTPGFEMDVKLASNADGNILTPFAIPDYAELASGKTNNKGLIVFKINILRNKLDKLTVKISAPKGVIYQEDIDAGRHTTGKHTWQ